MALLVADTARALENTRFGAFGLGMAAAAFQHRNEQRSIIQLTLPRRS